MIGKLLRLSGDTAGLGLQVGLGYHLSAYGILGYGLMCSATGAEALTLAQQYLPLTYAFAAIAHQRDGEFDHLSFEPPAELDPAVQRFVAERAMGAASRLPHDVIGEGFRLTALCLRARARPEQPCLPPVYGAAPEMGAKADRLSFRHAELQRPLPQANPVTVAMCRQMCGELIEQRRARYGTAALVRHYLDRLPAPVSLGEMARLLNASEQPLKRWLQDEGCSFRGLLAASRQARAEQLLADERLSLTDIADRLGFSDLSTFSQTYKRWTGMTPSAARKERGAARLIPRKVPE